MRRGQSLPDNHPMVREHGPFRERFEEYILERTKDYPSWFP